MWILGFCDRVEIELGIGLHAICGDDIVPFGRSVQEMAQMEDCVVSRPRFGCQPCRAGRASQVRRAKASLTGRTGRCPRGVRGVH